MEMFDGVTTVIGLTGIASVWYFGIGAKRASHALRAELQRPKPWNNSGSSEQAYKLRELELRRTRRNRMLFAALSGGGVFLTVFLQDAVNRRMPHHNDVAAVVRPQLPPNLTNEGAMILIFLSWLLVVAAGSFLFFAARFLLLTAVAQRHRIPDRRLIGAFRFSSYNEEGRNRVRRAGIAGLLSLVSLIAFFLAAVGLHATQ